MPRVMLHVKKKAIKNIQSFVRVGLILSLFLNTLTQAAPLIARWNPDQSELALSSSEVVLYRFDAFAGVLIIPNSTLSPETTLPTQFMAQQHDSDLWIRPPVGSRFSLSPDQKTIVLQPVAPATPIPGLLPSTEPLFIKLMNANPNQVASTLLRIYPNIRVDEDNRQHAVVVLAALADQQSLINLIQKLDQMVPQVLFEAEILEINQDLTQSLGIQYDSIFNFKLLEDIVPKQLWNIGTLGRNPLSLSLGINALKTTGAARVLAQPRVATLDGVEARINSTQTTPVLTTVSGNVSVQNITTGITLKMIPRVSADGTVEAILNIVVSTPTGITQSGIPQFSSREASTTVRVKSGEPIAIGGLLENRNLTSEQKVPFLGDLPWIGGLFTNTRTELHRTDLIIIVTPRLINSGEPTRP